MFYMLGTEFPPSLFNLENFLNLTNFKHYLAKKKKIIARTFDEKPLWKQKIFSLN